MTNILLQVIFIKKNPDLLVKREILLYVKDKMTMNIMETIMILGDIADNPKNVNGNFGNWAYNFGSENHLKSSHKYLIGKANKGKQRTVSQKLFISKKTKEAMQNLSPEKRERLAPHRGKHWFNNGIKELLDITAPEGFKLGRLPYSENTIKNMTIANRKAVKDRKAYTL